MPPRVETGNWAEHEQKVMISILKVGATLRPKYHQDITSFVETYLHPLGESIKAKEWKSFERVYRNAIDETNKLHENMDTGSFSTNSPRIRLVTTT